MEVSLAGDTDWLPGYGAFAPVLCLFACVVDVDYFLQDLAQQLGDG